MARIYGLGETIARFARRIERMPAHRRLIASSLAAALIAATAGMSDARIWPAWTIAGARTLDIAPGYVELAGRYSFSFPNDEGSSTTTSMNYDSKGRLSVAGQFSTPGGDLTIFTFAAASSVDPTTGVQHVRFVEFVKTREFSLLVKDPLFSFDGDVAADRTSIVGTFKRKAGYFALPGDETGPLTFTKTTGPGATSFALSLSTRMDDHGRLFGTSTTVDGKTVESRAKVVIYGTHLDDHYFEVDNFVDGGKIRGTVKTRANGTSVGLMTIKGPKWSARLAGPVDAAGFHALCDFSAGGFVVKKFPLTLDVTPGPTPPPPPGGVKPPPNLLINAKATVINGVVTVTASDMPSKFFGAPAGLRIEFPQSDWNNTINGHAVVHADPSDASTPAPNARRCIVTVGTTVYATANAPADVTIDVDRFAVTTGGTIRVLATGTVVSTTGRKKVVDVLVEATVQ
jgi:hypothetical protein